jgi:hypothetical protein
VHADRQLSRERRDEGAAPPLVLLLLVIAGLIIVPVLDYAVSVLKANSVLTDKTRDTEAAKAGLRVALAQPGLVFDTCTSASPTALGDPNLSLGVTTTCTLVETITSLTASQENGDPLPIPAGAVSIQLGTSVPPELAGTHIQPSAADTAANDVDWWTSLATVEPELDRLWLPHLPVQGLDRRPPAGWQMPAGLPACRVYFPGTYTDELVLAGPDPIYFASGIYYFERPVRVEAGATVVAGQGLVDGCTTDQEAVFYAVNAPGTHNVTGLGATFVFGQDGRLVVDDAADSSISFTFNQRYVTPAPTGQLPDPSAGVSIMSVNGDEDPEPNGGELLVPGVIRMPLSNVQTPSGVVSATSKRYVPSNLTAEPRPPTAPRAVVAAELDDPVGDGAVRVSWTEPEVIGGSTITAYEARIETPTGIARSCVTDGALSCVVRGVPFGPTEPYTFTVTATNGIGTSPKSDPSNAVTPVASSPDLVVPLAPTAVTPTPYAEAMGVSWTAPTADGGSAIRGYTVRAYRVYQTSLAVPVVETTPVGACSTTSFRNDPPPTSCTIRSLSKIFGTPGPLPLTSYLGYAFEVVATNEIGDSPPASSTSVAPPATDVEAAGGPAAPADPPPPTVPVAPPFLPDPILDVDIESAGTRVVVPGYVVVPQGHVAVTNPAGHPAVSLEGGVAAGVLSLADGRANGPGSLPIGFVDAVLQRVIRIESRSAGGMTSTAIVRINPSGAYGVSSWEVQ